MPPAEMPTGVLADYLMTLDHIEGLANGTQLRASVGQTLRTRLVYEGTRLDISDSSKAPWWLMSSNDEAAIKALIATLGRPGWQDDTPKLMVGVPSASFTAAGTRRRRTPGARSRRSEEHTSELQSLLRISSAVFCSKHNTTRTACNQHATS